MSKLSLILASFLVAGLAASARADEKLVDGNVPFAFTAGSSQLPAGHYEILAADPGASSDLIIRNVDTGKTVFVQSITRLAERRDGQPDLVFDDLGGHHILSEIHLVGEEGYLLQAAGRKVHTHTDVKAG